MGIIEFHKDLDAAWANNSPLKPVFLKYWDIAMNPVDLDLLCELAWFQSILYKLEVL